MGYVLSLVTSLVMTWGVFLCTPIFLLVRGHPTHTCFTEHEGGGKAEPGAKWTLSRWKQVLSTYKEAESGPLSDYLGQELKCNIQRGDWLDILKS